MPAEQEALKQQADTEKRRAVIGLANRFEASVQAVVGEVLQDAQDMHRAAESMTRKAAEAKDQSMSVLHASQQASANAKQGPLQRNSIRRPSAKSDSASRKPRR
jgi:methyl-accepting chemotaxis protein